MSDTNPDSDPSDPSDPSDLSDLYAALDSAASVIALSSNDWSTDRDLAWLYGILVGWEDEDAESGGTIDQLAARMHWNPDDVARLRRLRAAVTAFDLNTAAELADLKVLFELQRTRMGEATARWRAEDPQARARIMPDLGDLLRWLMDDADQARAEVHTLTRSESLEVVTAEAKLADLKAALAEWLPAAKARHALLGDRLGQGEIAMIRAAERISR